MDETKKWIRPIICGLIVAFCTWALRNFWESGKVKTYIIDFLITFSPIFVGFLAFFIYWLTRDYRKLHKFSYRHDHAIENIQGLTDKIKFFEKEPSNRVQAINQLGTKVNKLEINIDNLNKEIGLDDPLNPQPRRLLRPRE